MPELPEVETIKNDLEPLIKGSRVEKVEFLWAKTLRGLNPEEFNREIAGKRIAALSRRGKYLMLLLEGGKILLVHFKMTGSFLIGGPGDPVSKHARAIMYLEDGRRLFFIDPRKFGRFQLVSPGESPLSGLGVEPLSDEFTARKLGELLSKRTAPVKVVLIDQSLIAGVGNMYADEALFLAGIHPLRPADSLGVPGVSRLRRALRQVLREAIKNKGASVVNYFRPGGEAGSAHSYFKVAHRRGKCASCPEGIMRIVVRGRGTYYCPACQH